MYSYQTLTKLDLQLYSRINRLYEYLTNTVCGIPIFVLCKSGQTQNSASRWWRWRLDTSHGTLVAKLVTSEFSVWWLIEEQHLWLLNMVRSMQWSQSPVMIAWKYSTYMSNDFTLTQYCSCVIPRLNHMLWCLLHFDTWVCGPSLMWIVLVVVVDYAYTNVSCVDCKCCIKFNVF